MTETKEFTSFVVESGLIWGPSPEIYGGLAGFYTYGPLGKLLKNKVEESVRKTFNQEGIREIEGPTILPNEVWKASGHLDTFQDRTIKCSKCQAIFRADKIIEEKFDVPADSFSDKEILNFISKNKIKCPTCKGSFEENLGKQNLMMSTMVGGKAASLRPETATGTYLPFIRNFNYFRKKLPFGVFQIGKAYRNEISPRQNVLRGREFTQAEGQIFIDPEKKNKWEKYEKIKEERLPFWIEEQQKKSKKWEPIKISEALEKGYIKSQAYGWCIWLAYTQFRNFGIPEEKLRLRQHHKDEKAFYADDAWDIEANLNNYGWFELCGVHDRTDYDLRKHSEASGAKFEISEDGRRFIPHVLEMAFGTDRPTYALIDLFYDKKSQEEGKTTFKIPYHIAPIEVSVFPLMKKPELTNLAEEIKAELEKKFVVDYDITGTIGKRYLRSSMQGVPFALTIDYNSLEDKTVTIRDRDTTEQKRVSIKELPPILEQLIRGEKTFKEL